jgi:hypothetical protein
VKRFIAEGKIMWITLVYQDGVKIKEHNWGFHQPTDKEMKEMDITADPNIRLKKMNKA